MSIEEINFGLMQTTLLGAIPDAKDVLSAPVEDLRGRDAILNQAILKVLPFIKDEVDSDGFVDVDATVRAYADHVRAQSIKLLDILERNIQNLDESNIEQTKALKSIFQLRGRTLITPATPGILVDPAIDAGRTAQESMVVIELAFVAAFGARFDIYKYVSTFSFHPSMVQFTEEYINIIPKEGAKGVIDGDIVTVSDKVKNHLKTVQGKLNWSDEELIPYIKHLQNINSYLDGYISIQKASNESFTLDTLNNPLSTAWMYTSLDLDMHIEAIQAGNW